ncbi:mucin-2 [Abrus precatorius]|uniref:Mucin-2 n=1 Tax=Abrus precatorius TaxID=3816 RepID=A0A8B8JQN1_ABRPR|nr:mucin-2 [Abrus precatorius]
MAQIIVQVLVPIILLVLLEVAGATPPGIAKNPSHASCNIKKYKHCYNLVHVCPKFCPDGCTVECASCKPICVGSSDPPPDSPTPSTPQNPPPTPSTPENPPPTISTPPINTPPTPSTPNNPPSSSPPTSPSTPSTPENPSPPSSPPSPPPPTSTPENPPPTPSTPPSSPTPTPPNPPPTSSTPPTIPSPSTPAPSPPSTSTPSPTTPSPSTPAPSPPSTSTPSPTPPGSGESSSPKTVRCSNKNYTKCYNMEHVCPNPCPGGCEVDCNTCKPVCKCDKPGAICQDPRFIGGDGITFYFHGKKDSNFCLVSDPNLHINAHFIGRRNNDMKRDFTWVQSIAILFDNHQLFLGAHKTSTWQDYIDHLALTFDGESITLDESEGATWTSSTVSGVSIARTASTNSVIVEVEGKLRITAKVVPITEEDSRIHKYGITREDCFAHLDLGFKFFSLSNEVSGVLGQTYKPDYVSRVNVGAKMPVMGGAKEFETTTLFSPDCSVARFVGNNAYNDEVTMNLKMAMPSLSCVSGIDGQGVVCRR